MEIAWKKTKQFLLRSVAEFPIEKRTSESLLLIESGW